MVDEGIRPLPCIRGESGPKASGAQALVVAQQHLLLLLLPCSRPPTLPTLDATIADPRHHRPPERCSCRPHLFCLG
jgi:hypothetical protein